MTILYLAAGLAAGFYIFKNFLVKRHNFREILDRGAIIIDVRTPQEFDQGHIGEAQNIPLGNISSRAADLKSRKVPIILCCASGMRSGQATNTLKAHGIECYNGGSWRALDANIKK